MIRARVAREQPLSHFTSASQGSILMAEMQQVFDLWIDPIILILSGVFLGGYLGDLIVSLFVDWREVLGFRGPLSNCEGKAPDGSICGRPLRFYVEMVPVFGFIHSKGRCSACGKT